MNIFSIYFLLYRKRLMINATIVIWKTRKTIHDMLYKLTTLDCTIKK